MSVDRLVATPPATPTPSPVPRPGLFTPVLFSVTAFVGAGLLFVVQPLVARMILPSYGGASTVWSTSSLFFQVVLLLAYLYAHVTTRRLGPKWQPRAHLVVLALPLVALPVSVPLDAAPTGDTSPVLWLIRTLVLVIGLPFAVVATTGPLLQRWYSWTDSYRRDDPYFLFSASNLGSFGGLLAYPLVIEPHLTVAQQRMWWSVGFVLFVVLTASCALLAQASPRSALINRSLVGALTVGRDWRRLARWTALAFLPSSLMLGVTAHISTDVAAIPLLWVVPLAIYLATFVVAFARTSRVVPVRATRAAVASALVVVMATLPAGVLPVPMLVVATMVMLALVAYAAHARLAAERPPAEQLTAFYLVVSFGGALGGLLNGMVAPLVFDRVLEFPLALTVVPLLLAGLTTGPSWLCRQLHANRVRAALVVLLIALVPLSTRVAMWFGPRHLLMTLALLVVAALLGWFLSQVPVALAVGLGLLYSLTAVGDTRITLEQSRSFYGAYTVKELGEFRQLIHGTTVHGAQYNDQSRAQIATTYYSSGGPMGAIFQAVDPRRTGAVGLGTGTLATYARAGDHMTFYEIDPEVVRIASDPSLFTYLRDARGEVVTVLGDGRLRIAEAPRGSLDLIVLDAFSSDAIPVHLLTEEALDVYASRLAPGGAMAIHISNRVFDLEPVLAGGAQHLGWSGAIGRGTGDDAGATASVWVVLSHDDSTISALTGRSGWRDLGDREVRWTDDYSSILSVLR